MIELHLEAVGLAAPGLNGWQQSQACLRGEESWQAAPLERYKPTRLPANEARRATELVRMAFRICEDLASQTETDLSRCAAVFASSGGDYPIIDQICRALGEPGRPVSPTQFHNSVHNSAAGYWSIATGCQAPSTSISAYDDSFVAGLLEAASLCRAERLPVILAVYDIQPPEPLLSKRPLDPEFGVALLLTPERTPASLARLQLTLAPEAVASAALSPELETLRTGNPAARSLPLLELIARGAPGRIHLAAENSPHLSLDVHPCR